MSALGQKQTYAVHQPESGFPQQVMSALPPKADICGCTTQCLLLAKSGQSASSFLAELSVEFIVQPGAQTAKSASENELSRSGVLFACGTNVSPTSSSSRRWPARSRPANLPGRNGAPRPSPRSALATCG